jgi:fructan beta-fructosidase
MRRYFTPNRNLSLLILLFTALLTAAQKTDTSDARFRPLLHFTPKANWMNDPNGMVYYKGTYHLFYQYYPDGNVWGPMHWGHATSTNLMNWKHQPVALYPDSLGMIFSGSAVVDKNNTSGFGKNGQVPLVAIFTQHDEAAMKKGSKSFQNQSIAYSLDEGKTWTKYKNNPVLRSPGLVDFRDPKVAWNTAANKWIMTLAVADRIHFYSSPDLKNWTKESEFGEKAGAHGGVWECPDLFPMKHEGKEIWVLLVSLNPGGPNKGSATQYFLGDFDGKVFHQYSTETKWIDYGPDNYAGVTWSNTGDKCYFMGWMSNWSYAQQVPTYTWRSAMTLPRELRMERTATGYILTQHTDAMLDPLFGNGYHWDKANMRSGMNLIRPYDILQNPCRIKIASLKKELSLVFGEAGGNELRIGYNEKAGQYYIDRTRAGLAAFNADFASIATAPCIATGDSIRLTIVLDNSSVELLADGGKTVMTAVFFPERPYTKALLNYSEAFPVRVEYALRKKK